MTTPSWRPELSKYGITAVMIDSLDSPRTYRRLMQSPNWIPFYDDGRVVMFGRADAPEPDLAAFKSNRLEPDLRAYRVTQPVPPADRPPTPTSWIDQIFRNRLAGPAPVAHELRRPVAAAGQTADDAQAGMPDPARCLLAIREARTALAKSPDDWVAYRLLDVAYRTLMLQETALLAGIPLTPENEARIVMLAPNIDLLNTRFRQRVHGPELRDPDHARRPSTPESRRELAALNLETVPALPPGRLPGPGPRPPRRSVMDQNQPGDFTPEAKAQSDQQLDQLNRARSSRSRMRLLDLQVERQAGPIEKALYARGQGAPGLAIGELEEAERGNMSPALVKPQLVDLYCNTGQPDRALELLTMGSQ